MKKLLKLVLLVGLFISVSSSEIFSQTITNNTDCAFTIIVFYSAPDCDTETVSVPANGGVVTVQHKINTARGYANQLTFGAPCVFHLSNGECTPMTAEETTSNCGIGATCASYTATLTFATGNLVIN
ncbi:MAG: hypothetical protein AB8H03_01255 [Saprospiraceae bacterium]